MPAKTFHLTPPHKFSHKIFTASIFFLDIAGVFFLVWLYADIFFFPTRYGDETPPFAKLQHLNDLTDLSDLPELNNLQDLIDLQDFIDQQGLNSSKDFVQPIKIDKDAAAAIAFHDAGIAASQAQNLQIQRVQTSDSSDDDFFSVTFQTRSNDFLYQIKGNNGKIISFKRTSADPADSLSAP